MGQLLTLIAAPDREGAVGGGRPLPGGYGVGPVRRSDAEALGRLYFDAYPPGVVGETVAEAIADIHATFEGAYGDLWPEGSGAIVHDGAPVAAILTVRRAPWDDTPDGPFVIELFTDRAHRWRGLARRLVGDCLTAARDAGEEAVGLRVDAENVAARALYASLGFVPWPQEERDASG